MGQEFLEIEILNESIPKIAPKSNLQNIFVWVTHECVGMEHPSVDHVQLYMLINSTSWQEDTEGRSQSFS